MEKIYYADVSEKKAGVAILISDRINFKRVIWDKEWHYIIIKRSILQEDITILNVDIPNNRAPTDSRNSRWYSHFGRDSLVVSYRTKHPFSIRSSKCTPCYLPKDVQNFWPHKKLHTDVYGYFS